MIHVPTAPSFHHLWDIAAWLAALMGGRWVYAHRRASVDRLARRADPGYFLCLAVGSAVGAWGMGSLNTLRSAVPTLSHSIAGALVGAILAVELWKWRHRVRGSTGGPFVIPLALGIIVGRWGCLFAGLADETFGSPTRFRWAVELGDGVGRHPVQIYESLSITVFLAIYWIGLVRQHGWAIRHGFHAFILTYAVQRFAWEWLKPYPPLVGPFNLFHLLMMGLAAYAIIWIVGTEREERGAGTQAGPLHFSQPDDEPVRDLPRAGAGQGDHRG